METTPEDAGTRVGQRHGLCHAFIRIGAALAAGREHVAADMTEQPS
ncbi:hypothetical protein [Salipiger bermudensis]|nr:hypothetical protein [Salipiger bermudensis]MCA0962032.1 hypothetical protein [Salipiger bermudensis]